MFDNEPHKDCRMIAAIYARKSTEQNGVADDAKSVLRQIEQARAYAEHKGWTVREEYIYVDDGIGGAEFAKRPGFLRLMNGLKPAPPFQFLVMSEESRLGREAIETAYALKQLVVSGVRLFFYLEDRERTLNSPIEKVMLSLQTMGDEMEREKARQRTYDAMARKARAGHVTGGTVFGYDNVPIFDAAGKRSHVERRINEPQADVVRLIFQLALAGYGVKGIAKALNAEGALTPRAQQERPSAWAPSSVREALHRPLYRGEVVWNKTRKRNSWGQKHQAPRPASEHIAHENAALRIVSVAQWHAVHDRLAKTRQIYSGAVLGASRPQDARSLKYLLSGNARCAICGGSLVARSRSHGKQRAY
jgi:site-specific DNA recombinase